MLIPADKVDCFLKVYTGYVAFVANGPVLFPCEFAYRFKGLVFVIAILIRVLLKYLCCEHEPSY